MSCPGRSESNEVFHAMTVPAFETAPPSAEEITDYDRRHFVTYLRLLDANEEGADWREATQIIFEIDPASDADFARQVHDSHLARAEWMSRSGYRNLLEKGQ
jgi:hypothetical protein